MGLVMIFWILFVICLVVMLVGVCCDNENLAIGFLVLGVMLLGADLGMTIHVSCVQSFIEKDYEAMLLRKQVIEYRMEHENIMVPQEDCEHNLYTQIKNFNKEILEHRTFKDNWWIGGFYNYKIATIDYIDVSRET